MKHGGQQIHFQILLNSLSWWNVKLNSFWGRSNLDIVFVVQVKFLDNLLKKHEMEVVGLEEEKVRLARVSAGFVTINLHTKYECKEVIIQLEFCSIRGLVQAGCLRALTAAWVCVFAGL